MAPAAIKPKPFIIWTLQRTGGTNLAMRLFDRSGLLEAAKAAAANDARRNKWLEKINDQWKLHEPFNVGEQGRVFGEVTELWNATHDRKALNAELADICALRLPIKHCVEMVPWEVSEALVAAAVTAGYRHIFLYRKNPINRLLSLQFAEMSGIWGPELKRRKGLNDKIFAEPLPVAKLAKREKTCVHLLNATWSLLLKHCARPIAFAYEDIYQNDDPEQPRHNILSALETLGLSKGHDSDQEFITKTIGMGDQGTREKYSAFSGIDHLEQALRTVPSFFPFSPRRSLNISALFKQNPWVLHATVDELPSQVEQGNLFDVGGVVVLSASAPEGCTLFVQGADGCKVTWNIQSPWIAKQFPKGKNCANARFKLKNICCGENERIEICLAAGQDNNVPLFQMMLVEATPCALL